MLQICNRKIGFGGKRWHCCIPTRFKLFLINPFKSRQGEGAIKNPAKQEKITRIQNSL